MHFYDIYSYGRMIADRVRTGAYAQALRQSIKPGCVVLDMGTGVGIWALLACQFGARKVYAIDPNDAIQIAQEMAAANGYADRIEFIQDMSTRITLPDQADVVVTEMHGVLPMFEQNLVSIIDARQRLLAPGGTLIPREEKLWVAVVEAPDAYHNHMAPWDGNPYGLDMRVALRMATNRWRRPHGKITPEQFLAEPKCWATLDYTRLESPNVNAEVTWTTARNGIGHGLVVWFDTLLVDGMRFSNAPGAPELIFGNAFFPWSEPVNIAVGDTVSITLQASLVGEDYLWRWATCVLDQAQPQRVKANFHQSTFFGVPLSPAQLRKRAASHVPTLNEDGEIDRLILELMVSGTVLGDIARQVSERFPTHFSKREDALSRVGELAEKYSR